VNYELGRLGRFEQPDPKVTGRRNGETAFRRASSTLRMRAIIYLMSIDILAIAVGFSAAVLLRSHLLPGSNWLITLGVIIPVFVTIAGNSHAYSASTFQDTSRAVAKGAQALLLAICAVIFVAYCLRVSEIFPRLIIAMGSIVSMMLLVIGRYFAVRNLSMLVGGNPFKVVLIHDGDAPLPAGDFSVLIASNGYFDPDRHDPVMYDRLATALAGADRMGSRAKGRECP